MKRNSPHANAYHSPPAKRPGRPQLGLISLAAASETIRQGVRNAYRKLVKGRYEDERYYRRIYRRGRYKVEHEDGLG
ncbi:MAG: hypothetical protein NZL90_00410 [Aquificaceae bacterium]|nr:hypothetical protein [Aquificaceae bacterium]